ncbi:Gfo/Idh/MocA family protein [Streptomyces sp. NPDC050164]|uniref:Gfo/Idh/MocA family protein n=1 Tax=Streptomyces sp. NPDC050164 TaxID=3365605 RepID=UPI00379EA194
MTGSPIRVLLVGAGVMGSHHGRVAAESRRCELVTVVDPLERHGRALAERFGADWTPEMGTLAGVDAVIVAASTGQHRKIALEILAQGTPLFMEKPLCANLAESQEIVNLALLRDIPLMCGFVERYNPAVRKALSCVESPSALRTQRHSSYSPRVHAGVAWDLLVHDVDIALHLFGGPAQTGETAPRVVHAATAHSGRYTGGTGEDAVEATLEFSGPRAATFSANRLAPRRTRRLVAHERDRTVVADLLNPSVTVYSHPKPGNPMCRAWHPCLSSRHYRTIEHTECPQDREPLAAQLDRFIDIIEGKADARAETRSILPSHHAIAAILDSANQTATVSAS